MGSVTDVREKTQASLQEDATHGRLLRIMALFMMGGGAIFAIVTLAMWQIGSGSPLDAVGAGGIALLGLVILQVSRRGHHRAAGLVLVVPLTLLPAYYVLLEGPKSTAILLFVGGVVYADFLLGSRSGLLTAMIEWALYLGASLVYAQGWLRAAAYTSSFAGDVVNLVAVCFALAFTAGYFTREMKQALRLAREQEQTLRGANAEKDRLLAEVAAREEGQRQLLERVHELGSPIIPLSAGVIAMPIIGAVDSRRAEEVIGAFLRGVEENRAKVAIVDVTGVPIADVTLSKTLLQMAQGARLLGAEPVLTGLSPQAAEVLANLELDFSPVTPLATLQEGLDYALSRQQVEAAHG
jgi:anti-anti-sigma regulatory factor